MSSSVTNPWQVQSLLILTIMSFFNWGHFEHEKVDVNNYIKITDISKNWQTKNYCSTKDHTYQHLLLLPTILLTVEVNF